MDAVTSWMTLLLGKIKPFLYSNGGPIISVQVNNKVYMHGCLTLYVLFLIQKLLYQLRIVTTQYSGNVTLNVFNSKPVKTGKFFR